MQPVMPPTTDRRFLRRLAAVALLGAMCVAAPAHSQTPADEWQFAVTPYLWLPTINGSFTFNAPDISRPGGGRPGLAGERGVTVTNEVGPRDYLTHIDAVLMLSGMAERGPWSASADLVFLKLSSDRSNVRAVGVGSDRVEVGIEANRGTETDLRSTMLTLVGGYQLVNSERTTASVLAGVRHVDVSADVDWHLGLDVAGSDFVLARQGRVSRDAVLTDGLVGMKGRIWLDGARRWSMPFYLDAGTGSSDLTWQGMIGVARQFNGSELTFGYRHLDYDGGKQQDLVRSLEGSGFAVGWSFRF